MRAVALRIFVQILLMLVFCKEKLARRGLREELNFGGDRRKAMRSKFLAVVLNGLFRPSGVGQCARPRQNCCPIAPQASHIAALNVGLQPKLQRWPSS